MKVDTKIVPVEVKDGWFKKKQMHQLQWVITLTDVEKAIINKAGLRDFAYMEIEQHTKDGSYSEMVRNPISSWVDERLYDYGRWDFETLFEAQAELQKLKANLIRLKEMMDIHKNVGTEDSFEL